MSVVYHAPALYATPIRNAVGAYPSGVSETIGERLKRIREEQGMTAARLGALSGVGEGAVYKIERGDSKSPSFSTGLRLAKALGVSPYDLAGVDWLVIARRIGHADPGFTMRQYGHLIPEQSKEAALAVDRFFLG